MKHAQPELTLQFYSEIHAAEGLGHDGDGCVAAEELLQSGPTISEVHSSSQFRFLSLLRPIHTKVSLSKR